MGKRRRVFEQGHGRKFLVIVDESPEVETAMFYAASRVVHTDGMLVMMYVIEPETQFWDSVRQAHLEEQTTKAKALFRLFKRKLAQEGFDTLKAEEVIREGKIVDQILKQIDEDEDIAVLVLGAANETAGPGPLVASLAAGSAAGTFPIPITIVPGSLALEDIKALA
ncbi:MAG: universal stress protein [Hyphomicrobiales bacterium]|nr:MAG: universal stress protein [Hyphomicrobiales bacterium]